MFVGISTQHITLLDCVLILCCDNYEPAGVLSTMFLNHQSKPSPLSVVPSLRVTVEVITTNSFLMIHDRRDEREPGGQHLFSTALRYSYSVHALVNTLSSVVEGVERGGVEQSEERGGKSLLSGVS